MNTAKQINIMIGLLFVGLLGTFGYFLFDNGFHAFGIDFEGRESVAQVRQEKTNVERGAALFALNCRACHGLTGQGALEHAGLPGAPLNLESVRPPEASAADVNNFQDRFSATIHCGRVGTLMPPWSIAEQGPLNDFQIEQLVLLITSEFSPEGWAFAVEEANHADAFDPHKHLEAAIGEGDTTITLDNASGLDNTQWLRIGLDTIEEPYEILEVVEVNEADRTVVVNRGAQGTDPLAHEAGVEVYSGPLPPPESPIVGASGTPPCGQAPAAPPATASAPVTVSGDVALVAGDNYFEYDGARGPNFEVAAGGTVTFTVSNDGTAPHNLRISGPDAELSTDDDLVSDPDTILAGEDGTLEYTPEDPGDYPFQCEFHPNDMQGVITVTE